MNISSCGNKHNAHFEGQYLYIDGKKYVESTGIYKETNNIVCHTSDDYTIYEIDGDVEHNYVVARSFLDQSLYVKADYVKDKTAIEGFCFNQETMTYIYDEEFINMFTEIINNGEMVELTAENLYSYKRNGIDVYVKYYNDFIGEYYGSILINEQNYMFYNHQDNNIIFLTKEMVQKLVDFNAIEE